MSGKVLKKILDRVNYKDLKENKVFEDPKDNEAFRHLKDNYEFIAKLIKGAKVLKHTHENASLIAILHQMLNYAGREN